eukprot:GHVR01124856.1.p1 GENE.GHVR01124856.1~~GHVR01124856.1.p1  ORF type:complete len:109 (-),score=1.96 GHVR01124856.1:127-453(-)
MNFHHFSYNNKTYLSFDDVTSSVSVLALTRKMEQKDNARVKELLGNYQITEISNFSLEAFNPIMAEIVLEATGYLSMRCQFSSNKPVYFKIDPYYPTKKKVQIIHPSD